MELPHNYVYPSARWFLWYWLCYIYDNYMHRGIIISVHCMAYYPVWVCARRFMCLFEFVCVCDPKMSVYTLTGQSSCCLLIHFIMLPKMFAISNESYRERYSSHFYSFTIVPRWSPRNISNITVKIIKSTNVLMPRWWLQPPSPPSHAHWM